MKTFMKPPRAIFFDFGDTLVETAPPYLERLRMSFEAEGVRVTYEDMERAYLEADWRTAKALLNRKPFPEDAWRELFMAVMLETLHIDKKPRALLQRVADRMTTIVPERKLVEGAGEFVELCKQRGIKMAILSNNDGRTREKAAEVGIADYFEHFLDSTIEGTPKPNPEFFERAIERMGVSPEECVHVGDLLGCDVMGAQAANIPAAWLQQRKYSPRAPVEPEITVSEFDQLARLLEMK
jgi:putative hydrolase of the HAD superfamily